MMSGQTRWAGLALVWALGVGLLVAAGSGARAAEEKLSGDLKAMQGEWVPASDEAPPSHWKFEGHTVKTMIQEKDYESKISLKETEEPRAIDFDVIKGPEDSNGKTVPGIYKIDGDRVTFCIALPGRDVRPTEFKMIEDEQVLIELKRK